MTERGTTEDIRSSGKAPTRTTKNLSLQPGLTARLKELLADSGLPKHSQVSYLCRETGRSKQTVHRWLNAARPGNPDLDSFALICLLLQVDANWLLGLVPDRYPILETPPATLTAQEPSHAAYTPAKAFVAEVERQLASAGPEIEHLRMAGDEMSPRINEGALLSVDTSRQEIHGNGIYVLTYQGRRIVRTVEQRVGEGTALLCENRKYREVLLADTTDAGRGDLQVVGKVVSWLQLAQG